MFKVLSDIYFLVLRIERQQSKNNHTPNCNCKFIDAPRQERTLFEGISDLII